MSRRIRLWCHDKQWRIQFYAGRFQDRYGVLQDAWRSHRRNGVVMLFESEQQAREYMQCGGKREQV